MIALRVEFVVGRFHANPWDRGTSDDVVDWPPAPWEVLQAITAAWYRAGEADRDTFITLLDMLAAPPAFFLPRASAGNTRHYVPLSTVEADRAKNSVVIDSFIAVPPESDSRASAYVVWRTVELSERQRLLLERCLTLVGHLGGAESCCGLSIVATVPDNQDLKLVDVVSRKHHDGPIVRRLAIGEELRGGALLAALSESKEEIRKARRLMSTGAAWIEYGLPPDFLMVREQFDRSERTKPVFGPTILRFALARGWHSSKPSIKDAIVFGELLRAAAIRRLSDREGEPATLRLAGKEQDGSKRIAHDHPYFLPFDSQGNGAIDGVDVWFPQGCTHAEYRAVMSVRELREQRLYRDTFPLTFLARVQRARSSVWHSATPAVLERFPKLRGTNGSRRLIDAPEEQLTIMLRRAGFEPRVELWASGRGIERAHGSHLRIDAFRRTRVRKSMPALPVVAATLRFDEPVEGPIILGRLAHFGLGRFEPAESA